MRKVLVLFLDSQVLKRPPALTDLKTSSVSSVTPRDQRPREEKSPPYKDTRYELLLKTKGVVIGKAERGITPYSKELCVHLLEDSQNTPHDTLFRDDLFEAACDMLQGRNEAKVIQDIARLIIPSAQSLSIRGVNHLKKVIESVKEGWNNSIPFTGSRPQPDYSVGFRSEAFSDSQLAKLVQFIGNWLGGDQSIFMATYYMFFSFLAGEIKCGEAALDVADRQNTHSMAIAARAVFELFRLVGREAEVDRQILSFSISHDHRGCADLRLLPCHEGEGG